MLDKFLKRLRGQPPAVSPDAAPAQAAPPVVDVTDADFAERVLRASRPAVVDFWADWCQPCQVVSAYVGFLAKEYEGRLLVVALDADENPATPAHFQVMGLPTLLFLHDGVEVDRMVGVTSYEALKERVEQLLARLNLS